MVIKGEEKKRFQYTLSRGKDKKAGLLKLKSKSKS